jgi:hypothetical protein
MVHRTLRTRLKVEIAFINNSSLKRQHCEISARVFFMTQLLWGFCLNFDMNISYNEILNINLFSVGSFAHG